MEWRRGLIWLIYPIFPLRKQIAYSPRQARRHGGQGVKCSHPHMIFFFFACQFREKQIKVGKNMCRSPPPPPPLPARRPFSGHFATPIKSKTLAPRLLLRYTNHHDQERMWAVYLLQLQEETGTSKKILF